MDSTAPARPPKAARPRYAIIVEALPGDPRPPILRLKKALKYLLRACNMKCVDLAPGPGSEEAAP